MDNQNNNNMNEMTYQQRMDIYDKFNAETLQQYSAALKQCSDLSTKYNMDVKDFFGMMDAFSKVAIMERNAGKMLIQACYNVGELVTP
jgi:hypothetical protein